MLVKARLRRALLVVWQADRAGFSLALLLSAVGAAASLGVVLASRLALNAVLSPDGAAVSRLVLGLGLLAGLTAFSGSVGPLQTQQQRLLGERVGQLVWRRLLDACAAVDLLAYESHTFAQRLDRVRSSAVWQPAQVVGSLFGLAGAVLGVVALSVALVTIQPLLVPLLLLAGIPALLISRRSGAAEFAYVEAANPVFRRRSYLRGVLSARRFAAEVRVFGSAPELLRRHAVADAELLAQLTSVVRRRQRYSLVTTLAAGAALAATLGAIVVLVNRGSMSLADAGAAAVAARLLGGQLSAVFGTVGALVEAGPFLDDLDGFLADAPPPPPPGRARELRHELELRDVRFCYPGRVRPAVDGVTLRVPRGTIVALVGENGSGKTTLAKIAAGLLDPQQGGVSWDADVAVPGEDLRASVSVIFQDFVAYDMTPLDNIAISDTSSPPDRARAERSAERTGLSAAIADLPSGWETVLGLQLAEGSDLSGGQWQRLALARALYRDSPLLIMDEPSASLDPRAEHELFADVRAVLDGRSALLISHRYSSVRLADYIYVLAEGRVVEEGTHEQLVRADGRYAELYTLQASTYLGA